MGKIVFSGIAVTDIRGKIGGTVFSRNRAGAFARNNVIPTDPESIFQTERRAVLGFISQNWRELSEEERRLWINAAESGEWKLKDSLGQFFNPSGLQLFVSLNTGAYYFGGFMSEPPSPQTFPEPFQPVLNVQSDGSAFVHMSFEDVPETIPEYFIVQLYCTIGLSAGIMSPKQSLYKQVMRWDEGYPFRHVDFSTEYEARLGAWPPGLYIHCRMSWISRISGQILHFAQCKAEILTS